MTTPDPPPGGPNIGTQISNLLNGISGAPQVNNNNSLGLGNATNGNPSDQTVGGAIGGLITQGLGIKVNLINIVLNPIFYGAITALGVFIVLKGLRLIVNEVPGAPGVSGVIGDTLSAPFGVAKSIGMFAATDGLSGVNWGLSKGASLDKAVGARAGNRLLNAATP